MKRRGMIIGLAVLVVVVAASAVFAAGSGSGAEPDEGIVKPPFEGRCLCAGQVELTEEQKSEIMDIHNQIAELKKKIVDKYQSYGAIDEETAGNIKARMDERVLKMEEEGKISSYTGMRGRRSFKARGKRGLFNPDFPQQDSGQ